MLKTTANQTSPQPAKTVYPCLKEYKAISRSHHVVLFTAPTKGIVVHVFDGVFRKIGQSGVWLEDLFTPFLGSITLTQE